MSDLADRLLRFSVGLTEPERDTLKLLLGLAAGELAKGWNVPSDKSERAAFGAVISCLDRLQPHRDRIPENGILWRGRPEFIDDRCLQSLQAEARQVRADAVEYDNRVFAPGGPEASALAASEPLARFIRTHAGPVEPTATTTYLYHTQAGHGLYAHVDREVFSLNALVMIQHERPWNGHSCLVMFGSRSGREEIQLKAGEMVLFFGDSTVHGRTPLAEHETVTVLSMGFRPACRLNKPAA